MHYVLIYDVGERFIERRAQFRDEHLARNGLVKRWRVQQWHTVVGRLAAEPKRTA